MKTRQYTLKIFEAEIEEEQEFLAFLAKNGILLQNHFLLLKGELSPKIEKELQKHNLRYTKSLEELGTSKKETETTGTFEVIDSLVRSGQEIKVEGNLLLLGRVNDGATIVTSGSCIALNRVDGMILCQGALLFIRPTKKTKIIYHNTDITETLQIDQFQLISLQEGKITITQYDTKDLYGNDLLCH